MPPIYTGIVRSVANMRGREVTQNARLFAAVTQAMDDAQIAAMDAKYHYNFWRPITAIRNGDLDDNGWTNVTDFMQEVANARIYDGVHYRNSNEIGTDMGKQIGELAAAKFLRSRKD